ncbi:MAG: peptide deformylase [Lachnospiraceae bacterium]|jgi:peptide deformylase|nr:peptide deformylase [Lachnospiraceae bacterium]HBR04146.1 peptide deformylase [Lachnospiraceae bacterium]HBZ90687.1 peptide deformylase [Lachnospiraceae bacterium]
MALRTVREIGDPILEKKAKPVKEINDHLRELINDMFDTMYETGGVGLAAPQIGILKRLVVIDCGNEDGTENPIVLINPEIIEKDGEQTGYEGCLSVPGKMGIVTRPNHVKVKTMTLDGKEEILEGTDLLARCFCHEIDHLDGVLYTTKVEGELVDSNSMSEDDEQ